MQLSGLTAGLLGPALRWSMIGLWTGLAGWIAFVSWEIGDLPAELPFYVHRLLQNTLTLIIVCSLMVQLAARIIRAQRRTRFMVEAIAPEVGYAEGYADGLARRPAQPSIRHLSTVEQRHGE